MRREFSNVLHHAGTSLKISPLSGSHLSSLDLTINKEADSNLTLLQRRFNHPGLQYSFGYGSGVFRQAGYTNATSKPQLDVIHIVENPLEFHKFNFARFPDHYSSLVKFGDSAIQCVQDFGAGVYFNPYVSMKIDGSDDIMLKYGVVSTQNAFLDLRNWTSLYLAGRLQKPVKHLFHTDDSFKEANEYNLESALNLSLLLISGRLGSNHITPSQLFEQIASISYMGDPRMILGGENPNKVKNIVKNQLPYFEKLYHKSIRKAISKSYLKKHHEIFSVTLKATSAAEILTSLPYNFKKRFLGSYRKKCAKVLAKDKEMSDFLDDGETVDPHKMSSLLVNPKSPFVQEALTDPSSKRVLLSTISSIIAFPALTQSVKGILTAGLTKSVKYAWEKKLKSFA